MSDGEEDTNWQAQQPLDDNAELHPLFWDSVPEDAENNPQFAALKALDEEATPEERAESLKINGNSKLKMGLKVKNRVLLREAIKFYSDGIAIKCSDNKLNSVLYGNMAQVNLLLGNHRRVLEDCKQAISLDPSNVKAYFRSATAALKLKEFDTCLSLCEQGRRADPGSKDFDAIAQEAQSKRDEQKQIEERLAAEKEAQTAPARSLAAAILSRGYQVTRPQVSIGTRNKPVLSADGQLAWPVLLFYPEAHMQQDAIESFSEEDHLADHLDVMFGPDAPPLPWDTDNEYSRDKVELYYLNNAGAPMDQDQLILAMQGKWPEGTAEDAGPKMFGHKAARWCKVNPARTLKQVLQLPDFVIPGIPVFFVLAKGTTYRDKFLAAQK